MCTPSHRLTNCHRPLLCWLFLLSLLTATTALAQQDNPIAAIYDKVVYNIPMRDGVKLYTVAYIPKALRNAKLNAGKAGKPVMFLRTPYGVGPYEEGKLKPYLGPSRHFVDSLYIVVYQDVRGKYMSEGEFVDMRPYRGPHDHWAERKAKGAGKIDESTDTWDSIEWLMNNLPGHNGRVGMWGISYPGFYASQGLLDAHPALKAVSPQAPVADWWTGDDFHRNGILLVPHGFNFYTSFGQPRPVPVPYAPPGFQHPTPDGYQFFLQAGSPKALTEIYAPTKLAFWEELLRHPDYDTFWMARNAIPKFNNIKPAVMTVGGFYDTENLFGALQDYKSIERRNPGTRQPKTQNQLVMGPWWHGQWARDSGNHIGQVKMGTYTSGWYRDSVEYPFFRYHLEGKGKPYTTEATIHYGGANVWRRLSSWPPLNAKTTRWYPQQDGSLTNKAAPASARKDYLADPTTPVPHTQTISPRLEKEYMVEDQRHNSHRPDVLTFSTPALSKPLNLSGSASVHLTLSSTATDADFFVKIIDVYPDTVEQNSTLAPATRTNPTYKPQGYQQLIRWDAMRARYRKSHTNPEPLKPGEPFVLDIPLNDIAHVLKPGHRLMVQIQSSWFPICERHPQQYIDVHSAQPDQYQKATHTLLLEQSWVTLDVVDQL